MFISTQKKSLQQQDGFTLIEIIVALMVISIALGAIVNTVSSSVEQGAYIKEKTIALWVAQNYIAEVSIKQQWPASGQHSDEISMVNKQWYIENKVAQTPDEYIRRMDVAVFSDKDKENQLVSLIAYITDPLALEEN